MKIKFHKPKTIKEAIYQLQELLESDLYTKFKPEINVNGKKMYRTDCFKNEKDFRGYLEAHFNIFKKQVNSLLKNYDFSKFEEAGK